MIWVCGASVVLRIYLAKMPARTMSRRSCVPIIEDYDFVDAENGQGACNMASKGSAKLVRLATTQGKYLRQIGCGTELLLRNNATW